MTDHKITFFMIDLLIHYQSSSLCPGPHEEEDESSESDSNSEDELRTGIPSAPNGDSVGFIVDLAKDNGDFMEYHGDLSIYLSMINVTDVFFLMFVSGIWPAFFSCRDMVDVGNVHIVGSI